MKKFIFNQVLCLQSVTFLKVESFNRYFLKVFFIDIRTSFLQQIYLPTYLPGERLTDRRTDGQNYLPTYLPTCLPTCVPTCLPTYLTTSWLADRPTDWLTDQLSNRPTNWLTSRWIDPSIYLSTYIYIHINISSFTAGKSMKKKNMLLLEKPGSILLKDKKTKQKMILVVEKLAITLYEPL